MLNTTDATKSRCNISQRVQYNPFMHRRAHQKMTVSSYSYTIISIGRDIQATLTTCISMELTHTVLTFSLLQILHRMGHKFLYRNNLSKKHQVIL